jgi:hypothetical protein
MMNKTKLNLCVLAVLAATSLPVLAASIDVKVIGTITPAALYANGLRWGHY